MSVEEDFARALREHVEAVSGHGSTSTRRT